MSAPANLDPVEQVLAQYEIARKQGAPKPGRGKLADATGLSPYYVRQAVGKINATIASGAGLEPSRASSSNPVGDRYTASLAAQQAVAGETTRSTTATADSPGDLASTPAPPAGIARASTSANGRRQHAIGAGEGPSAPDRSVGESGPRTRPPAAPATSASERAPSRAPTRPAGKTAHPRVLSAMGIPPSELGSSVQGSARAGGTAMSWLGLAFGSATSIAANVLHTWLPASTQPPGWTPGLGPQIGAGVWPFALIVTVEVLTRVNWRRTWFWNTVRYGIGTIVAVGSFAISYGHIHAVLTAWHYDPIAAAIGPLVVDGLMTISGFALLAGQPERTEGCQPMVKT